jgi:hypothetical protein
MKIYLKIIGWISIVIGFLMIFVLLNEKQQSSLSMAYLIIINIIGGIFTLAFAEILYRLEQIQKNTKKQGDEELKITGKMIK